MTSYYLSPEQFSRIAAGIRKIEDLPKGQRAARRANGPLHLMTIVKGKLTSAVVYDTANSASTWKGAFRPYFPDQPFDATSVDAAASYYGPFDCWPWCLPDKTTLAVGTPVVCGWDGNRWTIIEHKPKAQLVYSGSGTGSVSGYTFENPMSISMAGAWIAILKDLSDPRTFVVVQGQCAGLSSD